MSKQTKTMIAIVAIVIVIGLIVYLKKVENKDVLSPGNNDSAQETSGTTTLPKANKNPAPKTTTSKPVVTTPPSTSASTSASSSMQVNPASHIYVSIEGFAFNSPILRVKKGTTVTWTNKDTVAHTVTGEQNAGPGSGDLIIGQSYSYVFDKLGEFPYFCARHPNMRGFVEVVE